MPITETHTPAEPLAIARRAFVDGLPGHFQRLSWSSDAVSAHQTAALRRLLRIAVARSPYHARRLDGVVGDTDVFQLADLHCLPVMTKTDMMENFDEVTTDRRLTRATVEAFLAGVGEQPEALFGEYLVLASGGSSGVRGVFAWPIDVIADYLSTIFRGGLARAGRGAVPTGLSIAMVAAGCAVHATRATAQLADGAIGTVRFAPANLPIAQIVRRLGEAQPVLLAGYAERVAARRRTTAGRTAHDPPGDGGVDQRAAHARDVSGDHRSVRHTTRQRLRVVGGTERLRASQAMTCSRSPATPPTSSSSMPTTSPYRPGPRPTTSSSPTS